MDFLFSLHCFGINKALQESSKVFAGQLDQVLSDHGSGDNRAGHQDKMFQILYIDRNSINERRPANADLLIKSLESEFGKQATVR